MSNISYISVIERYHEFKLALEQMLISILSGVNEEPMFHNNKTQCKAMGDIGKSYPFLDMLYILDEKGIQISDNIAPLNKDCQTKKGKGSDRSQRPYFKLAQSNSEISITEPYLSVSNRKLCISAALKAKRNGIQEYLILDCDLALLVDFLMGDTSRRRFQPFFKTTYTFIVIGLFLVALSLIYSAFSELLHLATGRANEGLEIKPFSVIIFLTLSLAVFDLGKTILEEEVLMHKDIFRHSSTRRTITRFTAAILIAVSIEALLLMFKAAIGEHELLRDAVYMMLATVGLLIGLGIYVYLGAKAESILVQMRK